MDFSSITALDKALLATAGFAAGVTLSRIVRRVNQARALSKPKRVHSMQTSSIVSKLKADVAPAVNIPAASLFQDSAFQAFLRQRRGITAVDAGTEVVVLVDPGLEGEGSDSDMPEHIWEQIVAACREALPPSTGPHIIVRLTNSES